ncbi:MAG: heme ABC transporter permease [Rubrivivax sp.]|nr:MAG: heme ABC transporter permease [Rubrivivax sp.]
MKDIAAVGTTASGGAAAPRSSRPSLWWTYASPQHAYPLIGRLVPWFLAAAVLLTTLGLYIGFFLAPTDHQQGDAYRIIYVHVPSAWLSMLIYVVMAFWAGLGLILNTRLSSMMAQALAPTGALFAFLALWTGALWGRPTWGTWWVWDARLTSMLILLFLYIGFMALQSAIDDRRRADKAGAVLALVGVVNVPIIYFSVQWWNTLHQGSSISLKTGSSMAAVMLAGMLITTLGLWAYAITVALVRLRSIVLDRERHADWVGQLKEVRA